MKNKRHNHVIRENFPTYAPSPEREILNKISNEEKNIVRRRREICVALAKRLHENSSWVNNMFEQWNNLYPPILEAKRITDERREICVALAKELGEDSHWIKAMLEQWSYHYSVEDMQ